ncbi:venom serine carboxypeptidase-like [Agrilus planipennis]|uniref:Carboxypeptidase n=1 Tax=Agrilus planipennis TaxID=224129 RepID=A0A7F5RIZ9_AGRPL|nr:venom serine carboxypeptidase-like [Agrilus planipennis]
MVYYALTAISFLIASVTCDPLILTPLIKNNRTSEALSASRVNYSPFGKIVSYSGFLTVNEKFNSNMFFWFFQSENDYRNDPVILWLQGGPGASSLIALFVENGPFKISSNNSVEFRQESWTKNHSVLYIDNPVGSGFSFTKDDAGFVRDGNSTGADIYEALVQFFKLFPELRKNKFFIAGESYAGKYVPAIGHVILEKNPKAQVPIYLAGVIIGDGFCDPVNQMYYDEFLYQIGLIDLNGKTQFREVEEKIISLIKNERWREAFDSFDQLINGDLSPSTLFRNLTGFTSVYNYLVPDGTAVLVELARVSRYLQSQNVRNALHVGNSSFNIVNSTVEVRLLNDYMKSVAHWLTELLDNVQVLIYNGQVDTIFPYPLVEDYLRQLTFKDVQSYKNAKREIWLVDNEVAGYKKRAGKFTEALVRNAGHVSIRDQSKWVLDLVKNFTHS